MGGGHEAVSSTGGRSCRRLWEAPRLSWRRAGNQISHHCRGGVCSALLYYCGAFVAVHYVSKRHNIVGKGSTEKISISEISIIFIPIVVFLAYLTRGYSVINSAFYSTIAAVVISFAVYLITSRDFFKTSKKTGGNIYNTAITAARRS
jgi:TRAP-type uncharacterized transport system fused permease subunit